MMMVDMVDTDRILYWSTASGRSPIDDYIARMDMVKFTTALWSWAICCTLQIFTRQIFKPTQSVCVCVHVWKQQLSEDGPEQREGSPKFLIRDTLALNPYYSFT